MYTAHSSKLAGAFVKPFLYLRYGPGRCGSSLKGGFASDDPVVLDHALHADNTRVDRGNSAIAGLSRPTTGLPALAPAQRAGAKRLCALALFGLHSRTQKCLLLGEERKS